MRVSNPLANSYTKNQANAQFVTVDLSGSSSGTTNLINADTLNGKPASDYVLKTQLYPVGSIYISIEPTNPSSYFGGTWEQIQGKFLLGSSTNHSTGTTGGSEAVEITQDNLPNLKLPVTTTVRLNGVAIDNDYGNLGDRLVTQQGATNTTVTKLASVSTGGLGEPINIMPPYLAVYIWKRTA